MKPCGPNGCGGDSPGEWGGSKRKHLVLRCAACVLLPTCCHTPMCLQSMYDRQVLLEICPQFLQSLRHTRALLANRLHGRSMVLCRRTASAHDGADGNLCQARTPHNKTLRNITQMQVRILTLSHCPLHVYHQLNEPDSTLVFQRPHQV